MLEGNIGEDMMVAFVVVVVAVAMTLKAVVVGRCMVGGAGSVPVAAVPSQPLRRGKACLA